MVEDSRTDEFASRSSLTAPSPYQEEHVACLGDPPRLTASTVYNFDWDETGGRFDFSFEHLANGPDVWSQSSAGMYIQSSEDILLSIRAIYDYALDGGEWQAGLKFLVADPDDDNLLFSESPFYDTAFGPPSAGALSIAANDILIPANNRWVIGYYAEVRSWSGSSAHALGSGMLHFDLTVVPEPASASVASLAIGALFAVRKPGKRRR